MLYFVYSLSVLGNLCHFFLQSKWIFCEACCVLLVQQSLLMPPVSLALLVWLGGRRHSGRQHQDLRCACGRCPCWRVQSPWGAGQRCTVCRSREPRCRYMGWDLDLGAFLRAQQVVIWVIYWDEVLGNPLSHSIEDMDVVRIVYEEILKPYSCFPSKRWRTFLKLLAFIQARLSKHHQVGRFWFGGL